MNFLEFSNCIVCVDLRGGQAAVTQQLLDSIQIGPLVHEVGGEGVSEHVGTFLIQRSGSAQVFVDQVPNVFGVERFAFIGD
jgi:hypothetical protein